MKNCTEIINSLNEEKAVALLQDMLRFDTANPPGAELALAEYLAETMKGLGIASRIDCLDEGRGNVIGVIKGKGERPGLLFSGHLDVVPTGRQPWQFDPFGGIIDNGKIYGRGASDMKGGLAAMLVAAGLVAQAGVELKGDLIIAGTAGEEVDCVGARELVKIDELKGIGAAVIAEPSYMKIFAATKGAIWLEFTTAGKTAHGAMPECGNNAIMQMHAVLGKLNQYKFDFTPHKLLDDPTINVGTIEGGIKTNVVPDHCVMTVDIRTVPGQDHRKILTDMNKMLEELSKEMEGFHGSLKIINDRPPVETQLDNPYMQQAVRAVGEILGTDPVPCGVKYYTDASVIAPALGIPVIWFGPGDEKLAHQPDEYVEIEKYLTSIKVFVNLIFAYLT